MTYTREQVDGAADAAQLEPGCRANFIGSILGVQPDQPGLILAHAQLHASQCSDCGRAKACLASSKG